MGRGKSKKTLALIAAAWAILDELAVERGFATLPQFNNDPATSFEDIKSLLAEAIQTVDA